MTRLGLTVGPAASALLVYAIAVVAVILTSTVAAVLLLVGSPDTGSATAIHSLLGLLVGGLASSSTLIAVALLAARWPRRAQLGLVPGRASATVVLLMVAGAVALGQALESLAFVLGLGNRGALEVIRQSLFRASRGQLLLAVLIIAGVAGFAEELFFRGFMQTRLRQEWSARWAILTTAVGFGALHLDWIHGVLAGALGVYLGFVRERAGSVRTAALCHIVNNALSIVLSGMVGVSARTSMHAWLLFSMSAVFIAALWAVQRSLGQTDGASPRALHDGTPSG